MFIEDSLCSLLFQRKKTVSQGIPKDPIRTKSFGYHSATECRSYDRPKIRQKPTL
jgi:hypothetical protein